MAQGHLRQNLHRRIIENFSFLYNTIVAVGRIGIQSYIGHDHQIGGDRFDSSYRPLHQSLRIQRLGSFVVFESILNLGKQEHRFYSQIPNRF